MAWELYDLRNDWTQSEDVASKNPAKLKELQALFLSEARKYQVLPLDAAVATRIITPRPNITAGRDVFTWTGELVGTPNGDAPSLLNTSYNIKAEIEVPADGAEGMLITQGGRFAGYGFYLLKGKPVFLWNLLDLRRIKWGGARGACAGQARSRVRFQIRRARPRNARFNNSSGIGRGGTGTLKVDGQEVASHKMEHTLPFILQMGREPRCRRRYRHVSRRWRTIRYRSSSPASSID